MPPSQSLPRPLESELLTQLAVVRNMASPRDPRLANPLLRLANWYCAQRLPAQAVPCLTELLEIQLRSLGEPHLKVAQTMCQLAALQGLAGEYPAAEERLKSAIQQLETLRIAGRLLLCDALNQLGELYYTTGRYDDSQALCRRALDLVREGGPESTGRLLRSYNNLGALHLARRELVIAERIFEQNVKLSERLAQPGQSLTATHLNNLAEVYRLRGFQQGALRACKRALHLWKAEYGWVHPLVAQGLCNLAQLTVEQKDLPRAEQLYRRALRIRKKLLPPQHPYLARTLRGLAEVFHASGRKKAARRILAKCVAWLQAAWGAQHPESLSAEQLLTQWNLAARAAKYASRAAAARRLSIPASDMGCPVLQISH